MLHITTFKVTGKYDFPVDMLRYDSCYPNTQESVSNIRIKSFPHDSAEEIRGEQTVELCHVDSVRNWIPTLGRWSSFGWTVNQHSISRHTR